MAKRKRPNSKSSPASAAHSAGLVDAPSKRVVAARKLMAAGHYPEAFKMFGEAMRQEPNNVQTYVVAARAYAERFDFDRFEKTHEKLMRRGPRHPGVHHYIGETFGLLRLPDRALASYERAARLPGAGPPTWMELALLYERSHRLDEAQALIERAVLAGYKLPNVSLVRGRIQRRQKRVAEAEATFRDMIARLPEDSDWACQAWAELALMKDQAEDFVGAAEAIERCKRGQRPRSERHWQVSERVHDQMASMNAAVTRDHFRRWQDAAANLPTRRAALLTGFPRSGTTLLEQVLDAHPDLVSSEERDFIGAESLQSVVAGHRELPLINALDAFSGEQLAWQRERYFHFMEYLLGEPIGRRMHLDKNPAYNLSIPLALRIFPEMRLVIALRDPRDVALSCYLRHLPLNAVSVRFLDVERTAERYALDMNAWLKIRELIDTPWCEIRYEDTVANVESQARRALETLGLPWNDQVLDYRERLVRSKQVTSPTYEAVAQPIYTQAIGRWKHYEQLLAPAMKTLEPFVREFGYDA